MHSPGTSTLTSWHHEILMRSSPLTDRKRLCYVRFSAEFTHEPPESVAKSNGTGSVVLRTLCPGPRFLRLLDICCSHCWFPTRGMHRPLIRVSNAKPGHLNMISVTTRVCLPSNQFAFHLISLPASHELLFLFLYLSTASRTLVKGSLKGPNRVGWPCLPGDQVGHLSNQLLSLTCTSCSSSSCSWQVPAAAASITGFCS